MLEQRAHPVGTLVVEEKIPLACPIPKALMNVTAAAG
jgi:hypothetical protein